MPELDFWYSIGSTYSYLTVMRITDAAARAGVSVRWRPFNVRHVMTVQNNIPFKDKPEKTAYMWRDIERRAQRYGFHPRLPAPYPLAELVLANQVAALGAAEGWGQAYTQAAYRCWFEAGQPAGADPNLTASLEAAGQDPARAVAEAQSDPVVQALAKATEEAMALGIFGAPSFAVSGEIFWGDDRLEDALLWAQERS
ncbi:2-hydroxychromene-2-carboxylate isomerase [Leisingera methylohalidivorans]|uniref:2-hydroxychromene-2-carboxylate isomerase n=1 Tax=Leisingera methylohalidivorans DSM 14336 TaxID=999552 RepID=V9VNA3_9RHOB|nr:2-hydroxychromene-2-carboxylate isomerase [Leisingera methylohalidivorans]AHD00131.1 2-hydroxychromene-2-carboxylate isomerase [Leisingera methylohalidivorans DSM 14336]